MSLSDAVQGDPALGRSSVGAPLSRAVRARRARSAGAFFVAEPGGYRRRANLGLTGESREFFAHGEGLVARAAQAKTVLRVKDLPRWFI